MSCLNNLLIFMEYLHRLQDFFYFLWISENTPTLTNLISYLLGNSNETKNETLKQGWPLYKLSRIIQFLNTIFFLPLWELTFQLTGVLLSCCQRLFIVLQTNYCTAALHINWRTKYSQNSHLSEVMEGMSFPNNQKHYGNPIIIMWVTLWFV